MNSRFARIALPLCAALLTASCTDNPAAGASAETTETQSVVGVVIAVEGDLSDIDSFTIRTEDGSDVSFVPDGEARFDGGPLSHVRDHLTSGSPIRVDHVVLADGSNLALGAEDA